MKWDDSNGPYICAVNISDIEVIPLNIVDLVNLHVYESLWGHKNSH